MLKLTATVLVGVSLTIYQMPTSVNVGGSSDQSKNLTSYH